MGSIYGNILAQRNTNTTYGVATQSANGLLSAADKKKLDGIAASANNYSHPTSSGNKHIPSGGSSGQILKWSAAGTAVWGNGPVIYITYAPKSGWTELPYGVYSYTVNKQYTPGLATGQAIYLIISQADVVGNFGTNNHIQACNYKGQVILYAGKIPDLTMEIYLIAFDVTVKSDFTSNIDNVYSNVISL